MQDCLSTTTLNVSDIKKFTARAATPIGYLQSALRDSLREIWNIGLLSRQNLAIHHCFGILMYI
eukprot:snap_masked-scaffold_7-processed-gene-2.51-mRNA-1 protein AED:1.00 eAED:1.00 QI:0/0/0/0/1/1/4/0/63